MLPLAKSETTMRLCEEPRILELVKRDDSLHLRIVDDRTVDLPFPYRLAAEILGGGTVQFSRAGCHCKLECKSESIRVTYSLGGNVSTCHVPLDQFSNIVHQVWHAE